MEAHALIDGLRAEFLRSLHRIEADTGSMREKMDGRLTGAQAGLLAFLTAVAAGAISHILAR